MVVQTYRVAALCLRPPDVTRTGFSVLIQRTTVCAPSLWSLSLWSGPLLSLSLSYSGAMSTLFNTRMAATRPSVIIPSTMTYAMREAEFVVATCAAQTIDRHDREPTQHACVAPGDERLVRWLRRSFGTTHVAVRDSRARIQSRRFCCCCCGCCMRCVCMQFAASHPVRHGMYTPYLNVRLRVRSS